uniref:Uncharacterized protein n=1 Tax=Arundo donax TaxID=35708 RepID=A0A0A9BRS4_ARUDO
MCTDPVLTRISQQFYNFRLQLDSHQYSN